MNKDTLYKIGFWSAAAVATEVLIFAVMLILGLWFNTKYLSYAICFLLALTFLILMVCIHYTADHDKKFWSHLGICAALLYAGMCMLCYYVQIAAVRTNSFNLPAEAVKMFEYAPGTAFFAINMLGYAFMTLSTLFASQAFTGPGITKWIKYTMLFHGIFFIPTLVFPCLSFPQSADTLQASNRFGEIALLFWCLIFIPIPILLAAFFKEQPPETSEPKSATEGEDRKAALK